MEREVLSSDRTGFFLSFKEMRGFWGALRAMLLRFTKLLQIFYK